MDPDFSEIFYEYLKINEFIFMFYLDSEIC